MMVPGATAGGDSSRGVESTQSGWCGSTHWSVLLLAGSEAPGSAEALEQLCRRYWPPVYAYIRGRGHDKTSAEDLTQGFFAHLLARGGLAGLDPRRGRFRSYLLVCVKNFLANEYGRSHTQKRWNGHPLVSLDALIAEERYCAAAPGLTPDALYDKRWALAVLAQALTKLEAGETKAGRGAQFARLHGFLTDEAADDKYKAAGEDLGITRNAVGMAVKRMRRRFREALLDEIRATVVDSDQANEELQCLKTALCSR